MSSCYVTQGAPSGLPGSQRTSNTGSSLTDRRAPGRRPAKGHPPGPPTPRPRETDALIRVRRFDWICFPLVWQDHFSNLAPPEPPTTACAVPTRWRRWREGKATRWRISLQCCGPKFSASMASSRTRCSGPRCPCPQCMKPNCPAEVSVRRSELYVPPAAGPSGKP